MEIGAKRLGLRLGVALTGRTRRVGAQLGSRKQVSVDSGGCLGVREGAGQKLAGGEGRVPPGGGWGGRVGQGFGAYPVVAFARPPL